MYGPKDVTPAICLRGQFMGPTFTLIECAVPRDRGETGPIAFLVGRR